MENDENEYIPVYEFIDKKHRKTNCFYKIVAFFSSICIYIKHFFVNQNEDEKKELITNNSLNILSLEEKEKRNSQLEEILKRQKDSRNNSKNKAINKEEEKKKISQTLEDMSIMGTIIKDQIIEEKITHPEKFVSIQEAATNENKDNGNPLFIMGLLAQNLENQGVTTAIEKESSNNSDNEASSTALQFMINGMGMQKKYNLHFDFGDERNEELLNDKQEQEKFR